MTTSAERYDAIILGAGQAGVPLATALAGAGWQTALVESQHVGGTCVNEGCTPTKTMVASARVAHLARRAADYGVQTGAISVDMAQVRQRKRDIVDSFRSGSRNRLEGTDGLDLIMGHGRFSGAQRIEVTLDDGTVRHLTAGTIFINTGARPRTPDLPGLDAVSYLDSTSIMELAQVPEHLLIIGGGYIGLEFGQMFRRFGSQVTIVQRRDQLLTHEDRDVAEEIAEILRQDGIQILLETEPVRVEPGEDDTLHLSVRTAAGPRVLTGSHLVVAAGRVPNTDQLNLDATAIETDAQGFIRADERLETTVAGVYALGDVNGGPAFTHISYDDFRIIRANLLEGGDATTRDRLLPYVVFIDPQLGRIGLSEQQAREQGYTVRVAKMPMSWVARALETDETRGLMKAVVDADNDQILGAAILGVEGGEVMAVLQMAMMGGVPYPVLRDGVFAHPSFSESLNNLFANLEEPD
ncbi:MAG: mercuric reductase [Anaerolineae bacterium]|jgi:pyruvate/2-oxoglutarate dehydrogenase complex dihydrolipoamide dehydrogenase (E3) component